MGSTLTVDNIVGATAAGKLQLPAGYVMQTVRNVDKTNVVDVTSSSYVEVSTNFRCTITPAKTSSKILVFASFHIVAPASSSNVGVKIMKSIGGGSFSDITDYGHNSTTESHRNTTSSGLFHSNTYVMLDEPSTTSAIIYSYFGSVTGGNTLRFNDNGGGCRLIVMEIAG